MEHLKKANARLQAAKCRLTIEVRGERLILRGTLPPKPDSDKTKPFQQKITLGLPANPSGIAQAEKEARKISALLDCKEFSWKDYYKVSTSEDRVLSDEIDRFYKTLIERGGNPTNWRNRYQPTLSKLNALNADEFIRVVKLPPPDTRNREIYHDVVKSFARFLNIPVDLDGLRGNHTPKRRDPPTDEMIESARGLISNPSYQWVYGMMATYGLRNHEIFRIKSYDFPEITIGEDTKTGSRVCFPLFEYWIEAWELYNICLPEVNVDRSNHKLGEVISRHFRRCKVPFPPYNLRHAFAIRTVTEGWPPVLAARSMGHSLETHNRQYHRWITRANDRETYDRLSKRKPQI